MRRMSKQDIKKAFISSLPVMTGYITLGMGFGILLETKGFGPLWAFLISLIVYAGSMQFVLVELLAGGASLVTTAFTALMVNARHLFYGVSLIDKYKGAGLKKLYMIFALSDETYSLVCSEELVKDVEDKHGYFFLVSFLNQIYWLIGSVLGGVAGTLITFDITGIDFALTALFVTIFVEQWLGTKDHMPALVGLCASVVCLLVFGSEKFLIPAMICITVALLVMKNHRREEV